MLKRLKTLLLICLLIAIIFPLHPSFAKTLILDGRLKSTIKMNQQINFSVPKKVDKLTFRFAVPVIYSNKATSQSIEDLQIKFSPNPTSIKEDTDGFGNTFRKVVWEGLEQDVSIKVSFNASLNSELTTMASEAVFPIKNIQETEAVFLKPTSQVQSTDEEIIALSRKLTGNAVTEYDAVDAILNWVADNIKYTYNPPEFDALYTLRTGTGNCQNFAHLSMSLLRASGIPSRIVGGISLKRQWKVPVSGGYLVQDMGQGGHAWIEIFFPDLGWLSYDPQQSRQFLSSRHIKQTHGLDSKDINDGWSASPYLPQYSENIEASFSNDDININLNTEKTAPLAYILSNNLLAKTSAQRPLPLALIEPEVKPPPEKGPVEFGNMEFPSLVELYQVVGNEAVKILDKETAEHVTSRYVYAQAFELRGTMALQGVSLAMHKFGGDGSLFVDVVKDEGGKPSLSGQRSLPVFLTDIKGRRQGYYWIDFSFSKPNEPLPVLNEGRYWLVLRHSGEAILNWFYIPGNPYGDGDDTRSTVKGYKWEDILNYDFVFKAKGVVK
ncbi:MAG: transglutaminase family protein [Nitrospirae bacterium]|nr:transglutaminase family protein [Nitrospirota bacterium]